MNPVKTATAEVKAALAERMNRIPEVEWDRAILHDGSAAVYGWVDRDGRKDFVVIAAQWGKTDDLDGKPLTWFAVGFTTSSAALSAKISERLYGDASNHRDCELVDDVFGDLVNRKRMKR